MNLGNRHQNSRNKRDKEKNDVLGNFARQTYGNVRILSTISVAELATRNEVMGIFFSLETHVFPVSRGT